MTPEHPTDDWYLLERWRGGDKEAGRILVGRYYQQISRFFANKVAIAHDAADLTQDTFLACSGKLDVIGTIAPEQTETSFRRYLFGIAANLLRRYISKRLKRAREIDDFAEVCVRDYVPSLHSIVVRRREELLVVSALRELPLDQQIVIELNLFESLSGAEIAEILGIAEGTVRSRLRLARARLERRIEELAESPTELQSTLTNLASWALQLRRRIDGDGDDEKPT